MGLSSSRAVRYAAPVSSVVALIVSMSPICVRAASVGSDDSDPPPAATESETQALRRELREEQARIRALEQRLAADEATHASVPQANPTLTPANPDSLLGSFGPDGFVLRSADGANQIRLRGNVSVDYRDFSDAGTPITADTFLVRKLRPILEGTLENRFDFRFMPDFGLGKTIIQDAWADARIEPWLALTFGKFKAPVGLERLQLEQFARFIEPALTADLLPYRDLGADVSGSIGGGLLSYAAGIFDGDVDGGSTDGNSTPDTNSTGRFSWEGRLFSKPFVQTDIGALKGLGFGVAGTYVKWVGVATTSSTVSLLAGDKTTGQQSMFSYRGNTSTAAAVNNATIADGIERRLVPQFYYAYRFVSLLGEYVDEDQQVRRQLSATGARTAALHNSAEQLQLAVFLTGEDEGYSVATPRHNFGFGDSGSGAWEWVARVHEIHFDSQAFAGGAGSFANPTTAPLSAHALGTGINWYLTQNFKIQLDYEVTRFTGGATRGDRTDERVLTSQFALIF